MTGATLNLTFTDFGGGPALRAMQARAENLRPLMDEIGQALESSTLTRFSTNIGPDGKAWKQSVRAKKTGTKTLVDRGHLRDEIHYFVDGDDAVEIGSSKEYSAIHQFGGDIHHPGGTKFFIKDGRAHFISNHSEKAAWAFPETRAHDIPMPARPFLGISEADSRDILSIVGRYLSGAGRA